MFRHRIPLDIDKEDFTGFDRRSQGIKIFMTEEQLADTTAAYRDPHKILRAIRGSHGIDDQLMTIINLLVVRQKGEILGPTALSRMSDISVSTVRRRLKLLVKMNILIINEIYKFNGFLKRPTVVMEIHPRFL